MHGPIHIKLSPIFWPLTICKRQAINKLSAGRMDECPDRRLQSGHSSILPALNSQPAATPEPDGLCGNQRYSHELPDDEHNGARNMLSLTYA